MTLLFKNILPALAFLLTVSGGRLSAQEFSGCAVTYMQTTRYDFDAIFGTFDDPAANEWVASIPRRHDENFVLYVTSGHSLYRHDPNAANDQPEILQQALQKADYFQVPGTVTRQVYHDFNKRVTIRQVEFMTRLFRIAGQIQSYAWKFTGEMIKILDYICMGAEMREGENRITAWFTSEIPVPAGPAHYTGLPGLILALEINGETAFLAIRTEMSPPSEALLKPPADGKEMEREAFDALVREKTKEWQETKNSGKFSGRKN